MTKNEKLTTKKKFPNLGKIFFRGNLCKIYNFVVNKNVIWGLDVQLSFVNEIEWK